MVADLRRRRDRQTPSPGCSRPWRPISAPQPRDAIALALARAALEAGPAVMEEYARGSGARTKADGSPVTARRRARRGDHPGAAERAGARRRRSSPRRRRAAGAPLDVGAALLPGRSARRHEGIHLPQRRVHDQHRADRSGRAGRRRGLRAGAEPPLVLAARAPMSARRRSAANCPARPSGGNCAPARPPPASSRSRAARTATRRPKRFLPDCRSRSASRRAPR